VFPLKDENPHPPGFKPKITYALIVINVIVFFYEIVVTGQFFEFTNQQSFFLFYEWGTVPDCIMGASSVVLNGLRIPHTERDTHTLRNRHPH